MRLSEAIALGRTLIKATPLTIMGCAMGMAVAACVETATPYDAIAELWPWATRNNGAPIPCGCPERHLGASLSISVIVQHLFDGHVFGSKDWTLDQLIDWVRSVEPEETPSLPEAVATQEAHAEVGEKNLIES